MKLPMPGSIIYVQNSAKDTKNANIVASILFGVKRTKSAQKGTVANAIM